MMWGVFMEKMVLTLATAVLLLCGCSSLDSGILSESEKLTIIDMARYTITKMPKNKKFVTAAEADAINKKMPEVRVRYTGPRQGKMFISWSVDSNDKEGKTVNFVYSGKFLTDSAMWRMGIVKYKKHKSKKKVNPYHKVKGVEGADFKDLMKKNVILGKKRP